MQLKKLMGVVAGLLCAAAMVLPTVPTKAATQIYNNKTGVIDGYDYTLWKDYGNTTMSLYGGGSFGCEWNSIGNALFRTGKTLGSRQNYASYGNITCDYECDYHPNGNSYLCVYGWSQNPLVEYYIVDSWGSWRPPGGSSKGQIYVDGGTYDVYETTRYNQPSIEGDKTFKQYWSVRTSKKTSGRITVSDHFKAWAQKGMSLGNLYEVALNVEGYQSSGWATVSKNVLTFGGSSSNNNNNNNNNNSNNNNNNSNNSNNNNSGGWNGLTVQCENMNLGGQYAGKINSPFSGVTLYGNNDSCSYTQNFGYGTHDFTLRGCSSNNKLASVDLYIGNQKKGTFYYGDNYPASYTIKNVSHALGDQQVKLVCNSDDGTWDVNLDYLQIN